MRTHVLTVEELRQRDECLAAGKPWPPVEDHIQMKEKLQILEVQNQELAKVAKVEASRRKLSPAERHRTLDDICAKYGIEPAEELIKMCFATNQDGTPSLSTDQRIKVLSELLQYRMPKLKSIEVEGQVDHNITVFVKKFGDIEEKPIRVFELGNNKMRGG